MKLISFKSMHFCLCIISTYVYGIVGTDPAYLSASIRNILQQIQSEKIVEKQVVRIVQQMPKDPTLVVQYVRNMTLDVAIKNLIAEASIRALSPTSYKHESQSLTNVLLDYLVYLVQKKIVASYLESNPDVPYDLEVVLDALPLEMCGCEQAPVATRMALIVLSLHQLKQRFDSGSEIVFTSLGPGDLLFESLFARALKLADYQLTINLIDRAYREIVPESRHRNIKKRAAYMQEFVEKLGIAVKMYGPGKPSLKDMRKTINIFSSVNDYIEACEQYPDLKSILLIAVDPGSYPRPLRRPGGKFFRLAVSRADITIPWWGRNRELVIYLPRYSRPRLYWDRLVFDKKNRQEIMCSIIKLADKLESLRQSNINQYRSEFVDGVLRIIKEARQQMQQQFSGKQYWLDWPIAVTYKTDPYIIFQELVIETLRPDGIAFQLGSDVIEQVSKEFYEREGYLSLFEKTGDEDIRCILISKEFIPQYL